MSPPEKSYLVNKIIEINNFKSYLELGTNDPRSKKSMFYHIKCNKKIGVDRLFKTDYTGEAADFLKENNRKFDCIYIDCDYSHQGSLQLACSSKDSLSDNGMIMMNFADPLSESWQREESGDDWIGQVWKTALNLHYDDSKMFDVIIIKNTGKASGRPQDVLSLSEAEGVTHGIAVIRKLSKEISDRIRQESVFKEKFLEYSFYENHKTDIMNIVSVGEFLSRCCTYDQHIEYSKQFWSKK